MGKLQRFANLAANFLCPMLAGPRTPFLVEREPVVCIRVTELGLGSQSLGYLRRAGGNVNDGVSHDSEIDFKVRP